MNILGLIGSPRRRGNCELLAKQIFRSLPGEHQLSLLRLADCDIRPCRGCYSCLFEDMTCPQHDDLPFILQALSDADALIVTVPTYFLGPNGLVKTLVDRGLALYGQAESIWGKPAVGAALAGIPGREGFALLGVENFLHVILAEVKATQVFYGALPGEVLLDDENLATAKAMAKALLEPKPAAQEPCCPVCGGKTIRFLEDKRVRCMLCSTSARLSAEDGTIRLRLDDTSRPAIFADRQAAMEHLDWLRNMVASYRQRRSELKAVQRGLRGVGRPLGRQPADGSDSGAGGGD